MLFMDWDVKKIRAALGVKLVGNLFMRQAVCETLLVLPAEIIDYITKNVWFFSSDEEAYGYTFDGNDLRGKHFIVFSDELFQQDLHQIRYTIIHEIGHVMLQHKNSIYQNQTQSEINRQEKEADTFAKQYLNG